MKSESMKILFAYVLFASALLIGPFATCDAVGQETKPQSKTQSKSDAKLEANPETKPEGFQMEFDQAEEKVWEFGLRLSCSNGIAEKVSVAVPVPIAWPEQKVELLDENRSGNIGKITYRTLDRSARFMAFRITKLGDGDVAEATVRYRVTRGSTLAPEDTTDFRIAKKLTGRTKSWLRPSPFIESKEKRIVDIGKKLAAETKTLSDWEQVEAIYTWVRENVEYKFDQQIHSCVAALDAGHGDCEELSSLFIAICRSRGIPARAVWVPGHTYPEFYLEDKTGKGHWFPCQAAGARHEFGEMREHRPILQKGDRFKLPGKGRTVERYVKPTVSAVHATGSLKIEEWIMREVEVEAE